MIAIKVIRGREKFNCGLSSLLHYKKLNIYTRVIATRPAECVSQPLDLDRTSHFGQWSFSRHGMNRRLSSYALMSYHEHMTRWPLVLQPRPQTPTHLGTIRTDLAANL